MKTYTVSSNGIREYLWDVQKVILHRHGTDESFRLIDPLTYYVNTGRASVSFLHRLIETSPTRIANSLMKGGSHQEALDRIFRAIRFEPNK